MATQDNSSDAEDRRRRWKEKQQRKGLARTEVRVPKDKVALIRHVAAALRAGFRILIAPSDTETEVDIMSDMEASWTLDSLSKALGETDLVEPGEFLVEKIDGVEPVLKVRATCLGDLDLFVSVSGEQIITSVLLWPRDRQQESDKFEAMMLRNHKKYLPLAALGVTSVDGREWYELFGAMSSRSVLKNVVIELRTIAYNAVDLSQDLGPDSAAA